MDTHRDAIFKRWTNAAIQFVTIAHANSTPSSTIHKGALSGTFTPPTTASSCTSVVMYSSSWIAGAAAAERLEMAKAKVIAEDEA